MQKVYVGLSGGVDSGTSAALLKSQGYDVTGVFIKIWQPEFIECTWREDRLDAMRVAAGLGIPFREIDLSQEYKALVVDAMIADYKDGITPNPDVLCNEKVKFGVFMRWALAEGADVVATGHYAQIDTLVDTVVEVEPRGSTSRLMRGLDAGKDQSYFLYRLSSHELSRIIFPIGGMHKKDVRAAARRFGLAVAEKPDSQGLCFVGDVSMPDFLRRFISVERGDVLDAAGVTIGSHDGAALYTIGQRHGFTLHTNAGGESHYVIAIDTARNTITVSPDRAAAARTSIRLSGIHWIEREPTLALRATVQARYHEKPVEATIVRNDRGGISCDFDVPHIASPGQSLVIYHGNHCLGGGIIAAA